MLKTLHVSEVFSKHPETTTSIIDFRHVVKGAFFTVIIGEFSLLKNEAGIMG